MTCHKCNATARAIAIVIARWIVAGMDKGGVVSNRLLAACRKLQMPPTAKAVLVCLADYADDEGACWPSIDAIAEFTCFGRTAVISGIRFLESAGIVEANRANGRHTTYRVTPEGFNQSVSRAGPSPEPVRLQNPTSTAGGLDQYGSRTAPVRQADSNHQEPSRTTNKATPKERVPALACPDGVSEQTWRDWLVLRKAKRAPVTETVLRAARREAEKAGIPLNRFLEIWCARGSQGLEADWLKPSERQGHGPPAAPVGKQMAGIMALEELKNATRNRMAAAGSGDGNPETFLPVAGPNASR